MTKPSEHRFDNILGDEYDLLKLAVPHYDEFEGTIGSVIKNHFKDSKKKQILALEIGPGSGITTRILLECDSRLQITAVDNEPKMLGTLKENILNWGAENQVSVVEDDIFKYIKSIKTGSFDVVASGFVLHNFENGARDQLIKEIYRVLNDGGVFINADKYAQDDPVKRARAYKEQIARYDVYDTIGRSDYKKEWLEHYERDEKEDVVFFEGKAKAYMEKVGFKNVNTDYREMMEAVISGVK